MNDSSASDGQTNGEPSLSRTARAQAVAEKMTSGNSWLDDTVPLSELDFALIGKFIQIYCFADFNARRVVSAMRSICLGDEADLGSRLNDTDVLIHLNKCGTEWTGASDIGEGVLRAAGTLELHRVHRHNFAHWIVRRLKGDDALLMLTKSAPDVKKRNQPPHGKDGATWALVVLPDLREEMKKLVGHGDFLAKLAVHLERNSAQLRAQHLSTETAM